MYRLIFIASILLAGIVLSLPGCSDIPTDRTYALWLDHAPTSTDWDRALPREVNVRGGRPHKLRTFTDIDIYEKVITGLCPNTLYEFSAEIINAIMKRKLRCFERESLFMTNSFHSNVVIIHLKIKLE